LIHDSGDHECYLALRLW